MMADNQDKNLFGGVNPNGVYIPMTEYEQEVLERLTETNDLVIIIHGWGVVRNPMMKFGDHRIGLVFQLDFHKPVVPMPVYFFDLELKVTSLNTSLLRKRYPLSDDGKAVMIGAGLSLTLQWDIAMDHMSPELVKAIKPGAIGLTTRRLDPVTGNRTLAGNMDLSDAQINVAKSLDSNSKLMKSMDDADAIRATIDAGYEVKVIAAGVVLPEPI